MFNYFKIQGDTRYACELAYSAISQIPWEDRSMGVDIATNIKAFEKIDAYWDLASISYRGCKLGDSEKTKQGEKKPKNDVSKKNRQKSALAKQVRTLEVEEDRVYMRSRNIPGWIRVYRGKISPVKNGVKKNELFAHLMQYIPDEMLSKRPR